MTVDRQRQWGVIVEEEEDKERVLWMMISVG